jgi:hypothetical protein
MIRGASYVAVAVGAALVLLIAIARCYSDPGSLCLVLSNHILACLGLLLSLTCILYLFIVVTTRSVNAVHGGSIVHYILRNSTWPGAFNLTFAYYWFGETGTSKPFRPGGPLKGKFSQLSSSLILVKRQTLSSR